MNLSPRSLLDRRLPLLVAARLGDHGLTGRDLILELTESRNLSQLDVVDRVLAELRDLGCIIALDDFGTGLLVAVGASTRTDPRTEDRPVVRRRDGAHAQVGGGGQSTVELARGLDLLVVAEGVERESQRKMLWELGCTAGQGHLFAKPMPLAEILKMKHLPRRATARPGIGGADGRAQARPHRPARQGVRLERVIALLLDLALYALSARVRRGSRRSPRPWDRTDLGIDRGLGLRGRGRCSSSCFAGAGSC